MENKSLQIIELKVEGMSCTNCSLGIKKALEKQGLNDVYADFTTDEVRFETDTPERLIMLLRPSKVSAMMLQ
jgi:P-type Cu+ transporter